MGLTVVAGDGGGVVVAVAGEGPTGVAGDGGGVAVTAGVPASARLSSPVTVAVLLSPSPAWASAVVAGDGGGVAVTGVGVGVAVVAGDGGGVVIAGGRGRRCCCRQ